jgi:hypothetical protein
MATERKTAVRGRGRPPLEFGVETVPVVIRMSAVQRSKLTRLGGAAWVRSKIDKAREPVESVEPV